MIHGEVLHTLDLKALMPEYIYEGLIYTIRYQ
jgi:hypothetical protein